MLHFRAGRPDALVLGAEHCGCAKSALALKCAKSPAKGPRLVGALDCKPLPARVSWSLGQTTRGNAVAHHPVQHTRGASPPHYCTARCAITFPGHPSVFMVAGNLHGELVQRVIPGLHSLALETTWACRRIPTGGPRPLGQGERRARRPQPGICARKHAKCWRCATLCVTSSPVHAQANVTWTVLCDAVCCNTVTFVTRERMLPCVAQ